MLVNLFLHFGKFTGKMETRSQRGPDGLSTKSNGALCRFSQHPSTTGDHIVIVETAVGILNPQGKDMAAMTIDYSAMKKSLLDDGFCVMPNVLTGAELAHLRATSARLIAAMTDQDRAQNASTGSMIGVGQDPSLARLIASPVALRALADLGYPDSKFTSGYIISKPPGCPRLFWHYDWAAWDDPNAFGDVPQQLFLMYYLTDTSPYNGCLRVIPGTHKNHHALLDRLSEAHTGPLLTASDLSLPEFSDAEGEIDVPMKSGDLLIGDSRLLHASHSNQSDDYRTVITLWYHPDMSALPDATQGFVAGMWFNPIHWLADAQALVEPLRPHYDGPIEPVKWNRHRPKGR